MKRLISMLFFTLIFTLNSYADIEVATQSYIENYRTAIVSADVLHLNIVMLEREKDSYQLTGNRIEHIDNAMISGRNNSTRPLHVVVLLSFFELRGTENAEQEFEHVLVNGKPADCFLFLAGKDAQSAIDTAVAAFPDSNLFETQIDARGPILFIDAGIIGPGAEARIEYKLKPRIVIPDMEKNFAIKDDKPMDPSPAFEGNITEFGCVTGFGGWVEPPKDAKTEAICDRENLKNFQSFLNECNITNPMSEPFMYDIDKDGCDTCEDYFKWKESIKELYKKEKRTTSGENLFLKECDKK